MTRFYGIKPWECGNLTLDELNEYLRQLDDYNRQMVAAQNRR